LIVVLTDPAVVTGQFREFYYRLYGPDRWENEFRRNASLIVAKNRAVLQR
jgi:hypothetical protein